MYHTNKKPKYAILVAILLFAVILEVVTAKVIHDNATIIKEHENHCECISNNCGCCEYLEWDTVKLNGTICSNVTYLARDYGFSVTVTYNNVAIINETMSARNPPPICIGEDIKQFPVAVCFRLYDIYINETTFHCCFELEARFARLNILPLHLGCFTNDHTHLPSSDVSLTSRMNILQITSYLSIFSIILSYVMIN